MTTTNREIELIVEDAARLALEEAVLRILLREASDALDEAERRVKEARELLEVCRD